MPRKISLTLAAALLATSWTACGPVRAQTWKHTSTLLDISGISWMENDLFVVVHDGKNDDEERDRPRVSLLLLPADVSEPPELARRATDGIYFRNLAVAWPTAVPHDLESVARVPGTRQILLVESGDDASEFQRIFLVTLDTSLELSVNEVVPWPTPVFNVEATAVFRAGGQLFFVYAERADGLPETAIRWATMDLSPLRFGPFSSARFAARIEGAGIRPIVALDVDPAGNVYAATAYDSGNDNGPFRSLVSRIGQFRPAKGAQVRFVPSRHSADLAELDGLKIEGVTTRPRGDGAVEVYAGTDDESYGAVLRRVAPIP